MRRVWRLRASDDFQRVRRQGRAYSHPCLTLSLAAAAQPHNRYGIITPKRLGKAVRRNQMRRRLRESLRLLHPRLRQGHDIVLIARPAGVAQSFVALQSTLLSLCLQAGLVMQKDDTAS